MLRTFTLLHFPNDTLAISLPDGTLLGNAAGTAARTPGTTPAVFADGHAIFRPLSTWQEGLVLQAVQARQRSEAPVAWNVLLRDVLRETPSLLAPTLTPLRHLEMLPKMDFQQQGQRIRQLAQEYGWRPNERDQHAAHALTYLNANAVVDEQELIWDDQGVRLQARVTPRSRVVPFPLSPLALQALQWSLALQRMKEQLSPSSAPSELQRLMQHFKFTPSAPLNTSEVLFLRTTLLITSFLVNTTDPALLQQFAQRLALPLPAAVDVGAAYRYVLAHLVTVS